MVWREVKLGAGGLVSGIDISPDGATIVCRTDVHNGHIWEPASGTWRKLITSTSISTSVAHYPELQAGVTEVRVAPSNSSRLYMWHMGDIYRSSDRAYNWTKTGLNFASLDDNSPNASYAKCFGPKIAIDPADADIVYVGTPSSGVYRSFNAGVSWELVSTGSIPACSTLYGPEYPGHPGMCFDPYSGTTGGRTNTIYMPVYGTGVYRSTDAGVTWAVMAGTPTHVKHGKIAVDGFYYVINEHGTAANTLYRWNGTVWAAKGPATSVEIVVCDPADASRIIASEGGGKLRLSTDRGDTWGSLISTVTRSSPDIPWQAWTEESYMGASEMLMNPVDPTTIWFAQGIGVWTTTFSGSPSSTTWTSNSKGIENLNSSTIICPPHGAPIYAGWDRSCFRIANPEVYPSQHSPTNDLNLRYAWDVDYATSDPSFIAYPSNIDTATTHKFGWKSTDGGTTWAAFAGTPSGGNIPLISGGTFDKAGGCIACSSPTNIIIVPSNNSLPWYTKDGGATWAEIVIAGVATSGETGYGWAFYNSAKMVCADRVAANTFYLYNYLTQGLYRSTDSGDNWTKMNTGNIDTLSVVNTKLISVHGQEGHLFMAGGRTGALGDANPGATKLMRSTDGGANWTQVSNVLEPYCVAAGAAAPGQSYPAIYFIGWYNSNFGSWRSIDNCSSFASIGAYPTNSLDWMDGLDASKTHYGTVYGVFTGSGAAYFSEDSTNIKHRGFSVIHDNGRRHVKMIKY